VESEPKCVKTWNAGMFNPLIQKVAKMVTYRIMAFGAILAYPWFLILTVRP